jgi:predicted RNase H-like HicB family nuclease
MEEIVFLVKESEEGGYEAKALEISIFTEGETIQELKNNIKEAVQLHFDDTNKRIARLHFLKEEIFAI